jgi:hypothetical protein
MCKITNPSEKINGSEMNFRLSKMKMSVLKCTLCLLLALALTGCGIAQRIQNGRTTPMSLRNNQPGYFTSTKFSVVMGVYFFPIFTIPAIIDLPFSLAADIVCLPVEIVMDSHRNYNKERDKQFWETYFASGASLSATDKWREHLDGGRPTIEKHIRKPLPKHQIEDLIRIGFVNEIAEHQVIDRELFELCLGDIRNGIPTNNVAIKIARNKGIPPELLEIMIRDRAALYVVIENPNITPQMLHKIIAIAKSDPNKDKHLLENSRAALARNRQTTPDDLEALYPSESQFITDALSENPNTPDSVLCRIFADSKSNYTKRYVSRNMASRASVTPEIQNFIFMDDDYDNYTAKARLIQNKAAIPELRSALIDPKLLFEFCWYKLLSPAAVRQIFDDASPEIQAILRNDYRAVISYMNKAEKE